MVESVVEEPFLDDVESGDEESQGKHDRPFQEKPDLPVRGWDLLIQNNKS